MRRNEVYSINDAYMSVINESRQRWLKDKAKLVTNEMPTVNQIKEALLSLAKMTDWNEFVNSQKTGECHLISQSVALMFPKMKMYSVVINFSDEAISQMEHQDDLDMYTCTHYLNRCKDTWFDFGKGTNRYEGIYVLDGIDDMYSCIYANDDAKIRITQPRKENPKALSIYLR